MAHLVYKKQSLSEAYGLIDYEKSYTAGFVNEWVLLENYFERPWLLNETAFSRARILIESIWDGVKNLVKAGGGKIVDAGKWALETGKKLGGKAAEVVKKIGGKIADVFTYVIGKLPGGQTVLDFLTNVASNLGAKIKEMGQSIKDQIEEWSKTAKKTLLDFMLNTLFPENEQFRQDIYSAMGVTEDQVQQAANEMRDLGINTITELNWALEVKGLILEQEDDSSAIVDKVKDKTGVGDVEDTLKVLGVLDNKTVDGGQDVDPIKWARGKAGKVVEKMFELFGKMVDTGVEGWFKYMQPLFNSDFFKPFESGFGLAASAFMGILSAGKLSWDKMVQFVEAIVKGFNIGTKRTKKGRAARQLFTGNGAELLKDMMTGIITGSNMEVVVRALSGDPTQIAEAVKRLIGAIMGGIKTAIKKFGPQLVSQAADGDVGEEVEGEVTDALGGFVDEMFPEAA